MTEGVTREELSRYSCSYGCGNLYQFMVSNTEDSTTEFLCLPCFVNLATTIIAAVTGSMPAEAVTGLPVIGIDVAGGLDEVSDGVYEYEEGGDNE